MSIHVIYLSFIYVTHLGVRTYNNVVMSKGLRTKKNCMRDDLPNVARLAYLRPSNAPTKKIILGGCPGLASKAQ